MRWMMVIGVVGAVGCGGSSGDAPTFAEVGPIFESRCISCHQEGGIGPFRLDTYADAKPWADASAAATAARSMPPFLVVGDGSCGEFEDSEWLTDEQLATIADWAAAGAPEGDGYTFTEQAPPTLEGDTVTVSTPEFVPEIVGGPSAEFDEYRCFAVDLPIDGDRFLTGYEVFPGNDAIVHHVIGMPVDYAEPGWRGQATNGEIIAGLSEPGRDGWPCFSGAGPGVSFDGEVISWAPGQGAVEYPDGTGLRVGSDTRLVFQMHYNLVDPAQRGTSDRTEIALRLENDVEQEAFVTLPDLFLAGEANISEIPPGRPNAKVQTALPVDEIIDVPITLQIIGVLPHMHERGKRMSIRFDRQDGSETCVAEVPNWDFEWQRIYFYEEPIPFTSTDTLMTECVYDTSSDTEPVLPGWGTQNEMCLPGLMITLAP
ncbi:MAG: hypothetical protein AAF602_08420 [Myxococcota bacterium]